MVKINWTQQSLSNIDDIADFIAKDSVKYAKLQVLRFIIAVDVLLENPKIGRVVPEIGNENIRELIQGNYRIIYKINSTSRIDILTVHHSRRILKITK